MSNFYKKFYPNTILSKIQVGQIWRTKDGGVFYMIRFMDYVEHVSGNKVPIWISLFNPNDTKHWVLTKEFRYGFAEDFILHHDLYADKEMNKRPKFLL
jgi:hypothetical protein